MDPSDTTPREVQVPVAVARLLPDLIAVAAREDFPECAEIVLRDADFDEPVPLVRVRKGKRLAPTVPRVWVIERPEHADERDIAEARRALADLQPMRGTHDGREIIFTPSGRVYADDGSLVNPPNA